MKKPGRNEAATFTEDNAPVEIIGRSLEGLSVEDFEAEFELERPTGDLAGGEVGVGVAAREADSVSSLAPLAVPLHPVQEAEFPAGVGDDQTLEQDGSNRSAVAGTVVQAERAPSKASEPEPNRSSRRLVAFGAAPPMLGVSLRKQFGVGAAVGLLALLLLIFAQGGFSSFETPEDARALAGDVGGDIAYEVTDDSFSDTEWDESEAWALELEAESVAKEEEDDEVPTRTRRRRTWPRRPVATEEPPASRGLGSTARFPELSAAQKRRVAERLRQESGKLESSTGFGTSASGRN